MSDTASRTRARRTIRPAAVGLVLTTVIIGAFAYRSATSSASAFSDGTRGGAGGTTTADGPVTAADGSLPKGVTVFDDEYPGVGNLDDDLLQALRHAAKDADDDGIEFTVNSGWRTPKYQNQLLRDAVSKYGSEEEAARWVATPDTSPHVSGKAVDIGPADAREWLSEHGAEYGLCQIYRNEPWHYELRPEAIDGECVAMYDDPTHDPRMHHS